MRPDVGRYLHPDSLPSIHAWLTSGRMLQALYLINATNYWELQLLSSVHCPAPPCIQSRSPRARARKSYPQRIVSEACLRWISWNPFRIKRMETLHLERLERNAPGGGPSGGGSSAAPPNLGGGSSGGGSTKSSGAPAGRGPAGSGGRLGGGGSALAGRTGAGPLGRGGGFGTGIPAGAGRARNAAVL